MAKIAVLPSASNMWSQLRFLPLMRGRQGWIVPAEQETVEWNHYGRNSIPLVRLVSHDELVLLKEMGQRQLRSEYGNLPY